MAQITPDVQVQHTEAPVAPGYIDSPYASGEQPAHEHKSMFGKLKEKTKQKTGKLKHKLKPGNTEGGNVDADTSSSSSEDEAGENVPAQNAFSGMTQPEYERKLHSGEVDESSSEDQSSRRSTRDAISIEEFNNRSPNDFPPSHGQGESNLTNQFKGLSTKDDDELAGVASVDANLPIGSDQTVVLREREKNKIPTDTAVLVGEDSILSMVGNPQAKDEDIGKKRSDPEGLLTGEKAETPKTWGQWVGEKVGLSKSSSTSSGSVSSKDVTTDEKPLTEKVKETVIEAKDTAAEKTLEARDVAATKVEETRQSAEVTPPQNQTYTQKITGALYGAKDSFVAKSQPGHEDKALSQKVTETVSNLPTTLKSSLGIGKPSSTPTTTPGVTTSTTEEHPDAPPQAPGIVSRITDSVTSMFGKKPADETPTTGETTVPRGTTASS